MESTNFEQLMPAPMCLVETTGDGVLVVKEDTARILSKIKEKTVVVTIVGTYRTGKSFLLNRLMGRNNGFVLGPTVESKTKGIWAWCRAHPTNPGWCLLLLDTEGLSDVQKVDSNHDNWIFVLSVLLSSTIVYNSMSSLKLDEIDKLHYVTRLSEHIKAKVRNTEDEPDEHQFIKIFPNFVWVIRDFTLTLEKDGKPITADEYLQNALKLKPGASRAVADYNLPRQCIEEYFREKKCFVLKRPVDNEELFKKLETLRDEDLQEPFLKEAHNFCEYIYSSAKPKSVEGNQLSCSMLCHLLEAFVEAIRAGGIPCMESAVKTMTEIANSKAVKV